MRSLIVSGGIPFLFFLLFLVPAAARAEVSLTAPSSIPAGGSFELVWSGGGDAKDFVTIVPADAAEGAYTAYEYARRSPIQLTAPDDPGKYEIRYLGAERPYPTLARLPLEIAPVTASLEIPSRVDAGAEFLVAWSGPGHPKDFITIVETGAPERTYKKYVYAHRANPATLRAPDFAGSYEVRYLSGQKYYTLASAPLAVGPTNATLAASEAVAAGSVFEVSWTGPDHSRDYVTIVKAGAPEGTYDVYKYTRLGPRLELRAPDIAGDYELRYMTGQNSVTLGSRPIRVEAVSASLSAPPKVLAGERFEVGWSGPDHAQDFIGMTAEADIAKGREAVWAYTMRGNPAVMQAPMEPGRYELTYQTGQTSRILTRTSIEVVPTEVRPGRLVVRGTETVSGQLRFEADSAIEIILDASGSMLKRQDGSRRIDTAKEVLTELTTSTIPAGTPFAMRVFGHRETDSCRTDLEVPLQPLEPAAVAAKIARIEAMNLAKTPIGASLELVAEDLRSVSGERVVVLVTDGEETCDGDPAAAIEHLRSGGVDVRVNIVGFAIDDKALKAKFRYWAQLGGGAYHDSASGKELGSSLVRALRVPFQLLGASGQVVASGLVGGDALIVPAGSYTVRTTTRPYREAAVTVAPDEESVVTLP